MIEALFEDALSAKTAANSNYGPVLAKITIGGRDKHSLSAILMFKATVLQTTEEWIKEQAEMFLGVDDLFVIDLHDYESAVNFLMNFNG